MGYLARVVLHRMKSGSNDAREDYEDLHAEMTKVGFHSTISNDAGVKYLLPGGLYYFDNSAAHNTFRKYTLQQAYDAADNAVTNVVKDESKYIRDANNPHSVFVTEVGSALWTGLKLAPASRMQIKPTRRFLPRPDNPFK